MVHILLSTYNGEKYICEQLESIFSQTYREFKLYIRDDGSTDSTVKKDKSISGSISGTCSQNPVDTK